LGEFIQNPLTHVVPEFHPLLKNNMEDDLNFCMILIIFLQAEISIYMYTYRVDLFLSPTAYSVKYCYVYTISNSVSTLSAYHCIIQNGFYCWYRVL